VHAFQVVFRFNGDSRFAVSKYLQVSSPTDPRLLPDQAAYSTFFQYANVPPEPIALYVDYLSLTSAAQLSVTFGGTAVASSAISAYSTEDTAVSFRLQCPTATSSQAGSMVPVTVSNAVSGEHVAFNIEILQFPSAEFSTALPPVGISTGQVSRALHRVRALISIDLQDLDLRVAVRNVYTYDQSTLQVIAHTLAYTHRHA
jgi:hypothetical protein